MEEISLETKGRKRYVKRITFTIRVDEKVVELLEAYAKEHNLSKSKAIREILAKGGIS
jgi:hypothetical protein